MRTKFMYVLMPFLVLCMSFSFGQEKTISGNVTDATGLPLPGVSVLVVGTTDGTQTDFDGNYTITAATGQVLRFSYIGQKTVERTIGASSTINVQMEDDTQALEEVVVTGYGTTSKKKVTTSISQVSSEDVQKVSTANISGALQGNATGIQVSQASGAPGGEVRLRIRGATSINGSNNPLYIVDGVQVETGTTVSNSFGGQQNSALSSINPNDIESIEILKDAASAAIYGSRGSNGVVIITTKKGKAGKPTISVGSYVGIQNPVNKYDVTNYGEWLRYGDAYYANSGRYPNGTWSTAVDGSDDFTGYTQDELDAFYDSVADQGDDYMDAIYKDNAIVRGLDVSISGGSDKTKYYIAGNSYKQEGVILGQDYLRESFRMNLSQEFTDKFRFIGGFSVTDEKQTLVNGDNNIYGVLSTAILESPGNSIYNEDGTFDSSSWLFSNPVQNALANEATGDTFRVLVNAELQYDLFDWLTFSSKWGLDNLDFYQKTYLPSTSTRGAGSNGLAEDRQRVIRRLMTTQGLLIDKSFDDFTVGGFLGFEYNGRQSRSTVAERTGFASPLLKNVSQGATVTNAAGSFAEDNLVSFIGRASFSYQNKYLLEASLRADGSSKFGPNNKYGYFPSVSAGYILSEEDWFKNDVLTFLKVRGSYGVTGNDTGIGAYDALAGVGAVSYAGVVGTGITTIGNPDVKWEETTQLNFGASFGLWNDRITVEYDYFNKDTDDLLLNVPLPGNSGFGVGIDGASAGIISNVGSMTNKGHEVGITANIFRDGEFNWTSTVGFSTLDNEVTSLDGNSPFSTGFVSRIEEGAPLGAFYTLVADGLYQSDDEVPANLAANGVGAGDVRYVDQNGDGIINDDDYVIGGNPWADYTAHWKNTLSFKGFDLDFLWAMSQGNDVFNSTLQFSGSSTNPNYGKFTSQLDYWTPENTDASLPRPNVDTASHNNLDSTRFVEDGSWIKLRNVTLGYTLPRDLLGFDMVRFYVSGDNLLLFTDYSGIDPEVNYSGASAVTSGTDFLTQGANKVWKFGVNVSF
ncbi:SusC/RagA family TonB-linked outer membrane protein [Flagellimonas zhangzhouensis]|uniref:TonB-linked outer membrane protein, SusC/RagA family n=1 Tax=Flagellimonas zhangzhouensis TaxID=1073328 RepID=A0A1H2VZE0_9FLAO|nr:TonB-dependent receptor [Allomuricauda zhangzhouensis]SDQ04754.1 TonB-linked outer membrane protein, SusC/RagA family [Allomuricauda zhangzhouensis]SDW73557.1 TonB-linked outer membrane protein, SusC/RagA family [Allomuricauda zhangzhouensis]